MKTRIKSIQRFLLSKAENEFIRQHLDRYTNLTEPLVRCEFTEYVSGKEKNKRTGKEIWDKYAFSQNAHREELQKMIFQCLWLIYFKINSLIDLITEKTCTLKKFIGIFTKKFKCV